MLICEHKMVLMLIGYEVKEGRVNLHEQLECIVYKCVNCWVPMVFRVFIQTVEYNRENYLDIIAHKVQDVLVVPEV